MTKTKRTGAILLAGTAALLIGCSARQDASGTASLNVGLGAAFVSEQRVAALAAALEAGLPEYHTDASAIRVSSVSIGDPSADPMAFMAGQTRVAVMLASGEVELWITDPENARRFGDNGEAYVPLATLFSDEEIAAFNGTPVGIAVTDEAGNATGETSEPAGIDLSQNSAIQELTGLNEPQMFVFANSTNMDAAKAAFRFLAMKQ